MTAAVTLLWFIVFIPTCIGFFRYAHLPLKLSLRHPRPADPV